MGYKKKKKKRAFHAINEPTKEGKNIIYTCLLFPWRKTNSKVLQTESSVSVTVVDTANQKSYELTQRTDQKFLGAMNPQNFSFTLGFIFKQEFWSKNNPLKLCQPQLARKWKDTASLHLNFLGPLTFAVPFIASVQEAGNLLSGFLQDISLLSFLSD